MKSAIGVDVADHGCSEDHEPGLLDGEEGAHVAMVGQVELGVGAQDEVGEAQVAELLHDGRRRRSLPEKDDLLCERERTKTRLDRGR
jgi:hypothetical protein